MSFDLREFAKEKLIVCAHRGAHGANIPQNTLAAFKVALKQGVDMIELDVNKSLDGKIFIFHHGMERSCFGLDERTKNMTFDEVRALRYLNTDRNPTSHCPATLDEVFEEFKNKCFIHIDKFWAYPKEVTDIIRRHRIEDQILIKSQADPVQLKAIEEICPDLAYMVTARSPEDILLASTFDTNFAVSEIIFENEDCVFTDPKFIETEHQKGRLLWVHSIVFNDKAVLTAGHNDDTSLLVDPDLGWGWLADMGYDIMITDWPMMAIDYLKKSNKLYK